MKPTNRPYASILTAQLESSASSAWHDLVLLNLIQDELSRRQRKSAAQLSIRVKDRIDELQRERRPAKANPPQAAQEQRIERVRMPGAHHGPASAAQILPQREQKIFVQQPSWTGAPKKGQNALGSGTDYTASENGNDGGRMNRQERRLLDKQLVNEKKKHRLKNWARGRTR